MDLGLGFDQAAIGMALVGLDGRFQRVNRALCELLGRSEEELLARTIDDLADPERASWFELTLEGDRKPRDS